MFGQLIRKMKAAFATRPAKAAAVAREARPPTYGEIRAAKRRRAKARRMKRKAA